MQDPLRRVHLTYWDNPNVASANLVYAQKSDQGWNTETVVSTRGAQSAIGVTRAGEVLIAYFDLERAQLMLARKTAAGWETESLTPDRADFLTSFAPGSLCLALDIQDRPVLTYYDNDALKLVHLGEGGWEIKTLVAGPGAGFFHDLALDSQDRAHIAYYHLGNQELRLLRWNDGVIEDETVDAAPPGSGEYVSLALDANEQPHLCCWHATGLIYLTRTGPDAGAESGLRWQTELVETQPGNQGLGLYCRLGLTRKGLPKIAYYDSRNGDLKFARRGSENGWQVETADDGGGPQGDTGGYIAMALDRQDLSQIAYYNWETQEVKFVKEQAPGQGCLSLVLRLWVPLQTIIRQLGITGQRSTLSPDRPDTLPEPVSLSRNGGSMATVVQVEKQDSRAVERNRGKWLISFLFVILLGGLASWVYWHLEWVETGSGAARSLTWVGLFDTAPKLWLDWFYGGLIGAALYLLASASKWYANSNPRFIDFTPWYITTLLKGPVLAMIVLFFLTSVDIEIAGLSLDFQALGPSVLLVVAFILGFYNRVAREQFNFIVKTIFSRAYSVAEESFSILPGKANVVFGRTVQFKTLPVTDVVWLASEGKIENGVFTAPNGDATKAGMEVVITAVPSNTNIPRATAVVTLLPFEIVGAKVVSTGRKEKYTVVPAPGEGVVWSFSPLVSGVSINDQGILTVLTEEIASLPQKVTLMGTSKHNGGDYANFDIQITK